MNIEPLSLEAGEAADNSLELLPDLIEMLQSLFETEVVEVVGAELVAEIRGEFLVLPENRITEIHTEHVMTVRDLIDDGGKLAPMLALQAAAEDLGNLVRSQAP